MNNYMKRYTELKACLSVELAAMRITKRRIAACDSNSAELERSLEEQSLTISTVREALKKLDRELERLCKDFNDEEHRVFFFHYVKGLSLKAVAKKMHFSYARIKQIKRIIRDKCN